ncbi:MAG TPA: winged helix-turn-helix domain-containing protein [Vicinamibacterales bacterium]|nr:winged helix-turn-helix domain-containing protein [Vicinamibacterales bacterium]
MRTRFGPFILDRETRQLLRGSSELHLSPKAFDLLCLLIDHRPKVMDKTELQSRLWPDTYVVEGNLNVLIGEIRRALGDVPKEPRFIRTVHGVGYAFCGGVEPPQEVPTGAGPIPCWLVTKEGTLRLKEGENIVGRSPDSNVWLDFPSVSRRHARILVDRDQRRVVVEDLNSKNGTLVGGSAIKGAVELLDGDDVTFGSVDVKLRSWSNDADAETKRISRGRAPLSGDDQSTTRSGSDS